MVSDPETGICPERMLWNLKETTRMILPFHESVVKSAANCPHGMMPAMRRSRSEPAQTTMVKNVVMVKADVDKLLLTKYFEMSYQG